MAEATPPINETELEVRISEAISLAFPALDSGRVRHQKTFTVKLGHESIRVDGSKTDRIGGRLDILLELDSRPLALLELKKPGEVLDEAVTKQGLSYARALDSMQIPPLVITSNGKECRFFRAWDGEEWQAESRDEKTLQLLFTESAKASVESMDQAVQHLLNTVPQAWVEAISRYTNTELNTLSGDLAELNKPVANGFNIPRKVTFVIAYLMTNGHHKIALHGDPFSGKTNVLASLCTNPTFKDFCFLYVNLATSSEGIFDRIASTFTQQFFRTFTKEQVRTWIVNQLQREKGVRLVILVDGIDATELNCFKQDLDVLATNANQGLIYLVMAGHRDLIQTLSTIPGKTQSTVIGEKLAWVKLKPLDKDELQSAEELLYEEYRAALEGCSDLVFELRQPRLLRLLASRLPTIRMTEESRAKTDEVAVLFSVPNPRWFQAFYDLFSTAEGRENFRRLAQALIADSERKVHPGDILRMRALGGLTVETVERMVDAERRTWLTERGYLQFIYRTNGLRLFLPKIPEILAVATAQLVAEQAVKLARSKGVEKAAKFMITKCEPLPYNGITCALAILFASRDHIELLPSAFQQLLNSEPRFEKLNPEAVLGMLKADGTVFHFSPSQLDVSEDDQKMGTWVNVYPWLTLSYITSQPMDGQGVSNLRLQVISTVGSSKIPIMALHQSPAVTSGLIEMIELPGDISILHGRAALLEPIMEVIHISLHHLPAEMRLLCEEAVNARNIPLLHRLLTVARTNNRQGTDEVSNFGELASILEKGLKAALQEILT
jgi:hypothetical protein